MAGNSGGHRWSVINNITPTAVVYNFTGGKVCFRVAGRFTGQNRRGGRYHIGIAACIITCGGGRRGVAEGQGPRLFPRRWAVKNAATLWPFYWWGAGVAVMGQRYVIVTHVTLILFALQLQWAFTRGTAFFFTFTRKCSEIFNVNGFFSEDNFIVYS